MDNNTSKLGVVFSVFPGLGKSKLAQSDQIFVDLELSNDTTNFKKYESEIKRNLMKGRIPLIGAHTVLQNHLRAKGYVVLNILPTHNQKDEILLRYDLRGASQEFIDELSLNYDELFKFMEDGEVAFYCQDPLNIHKAGYLSDYKNQLFNLAG